MVKEVVEAIYKMKKTQGKFVNTGKHGEFHMKFSVATMFRIGRKKLIRDG